MIGADGAFAGVVREPAFFAPPFNARIALPDNAPKLIAETLKMLALYGCVQLGAEPTLTRKSSRRNLRRHQANG